MSTWLPWARAAIWVNRSGAPLAKAKRVTPAISGDIRSHITRNCSCKEPGRWFVSWFVGMLKRWVASDNVPIKKQLSMGTRTGKHYLNGRTQKHFSCYSHNIEQKEHPEQACNRHESLVVAIKQRQVMNPVHILFTIFVLLDILAPIQSWGIDNYKVSSRLYHGLALSQASRWVAQGLDLHVGDGIVGPQITHISVHCDTMGIMSSAYTVPTTVTRVCRGGAGPCCTHWEGNAKTDCNQQSYIHNCSLCSQIYSHWV